VPDADALAKWIRPLLPVHAPPEPGRHLARSRHGDRTAAHQRLPHARDSRHDLAPLRGADRDRGLLRLTSQQARIPSATPGRLDRSDRIRTTADSRTRAQAFLFLDYAPYPSASQLIDIYFGCRYFIPNSKVNGNIAEFCDPKLDANTRDALAGEADNSPDVGRLWAKADRVVTDDAPLVPLVVPRYIIFVSKRVANFQASASQGVLQDQLWVR
jgi:hypothetical protein